MVEESTPSSVRQIQQWRGSPVFGMVWERLGGDGCVCSSAAAAPATAPGARVSVSGGGIVEASAGVGSEVVVCSEVG